MIKKLRVKLIGAAMLSLFVVLAVIVGSANLINYRTIIAQADLTLTILAENEGRFPASFEGWGQSEYLESPEFPYETRYFYIVLDEAGNVLSTNIDQIAAIDEEDAFEYAARVWNGANARGFVSEYRYYIKESDSETRIVFLNCSRNLATAKNFALVSIGASLVGLCAVFFLLLFVSEWVVKPFSESYEKQKRFITDAGHELKTPLTIIDADTEILEMDHGESKWTADIHRQTKHLADLTNDLIVLSRMEENEDEAQFETFSFSDAVSEVYESFLALAQSQGKELSGDIDEGIVICGDEKAIRRLINILLDNALKYSGENGKISVSLKAQKRVAQLTVYNTTPSIKRESLPYLFDRFYRTDQSRNSKTGGFGLGLSIAASTVRAHKGRIWAETEDERSLIINVVLPC